MSVTPPSQFDQIGFGVSAFVEMLKNVCEIAAIGVGAIWTYFNFFKGRTYKSRLECEVDGSLEASSGRLLLKVVVTAKNVGLSRVLVSQEGTILQLHPAVIYYTSPSWPCQIRWTDQPAVFDVFTEHPWIESSEPIQDQVLVELPDNGTLAYRLTLKVCDRKTTWTATNIVQRSNQTRIEGGNRGQGPGPKTD
jgi:hypothetical protein